MRKHTRETRCWLCRSLDVIHWGSRNNKRRFQGTPLLELGTVAQNRESYKFPIFQFSQANLFL